MKVGILTYHFSINCGAVLQCYALQEFYIAQGIPVEVINYISPLQQDNIELYRKIINKKNIIKNVLLLPFHLQRKERIQRFKAFHNNYLKCSRVVRNSDELQDLINEDGITHIVVGSDQVWNPLIEDFDSAFFLDFSTNAHKLGFSISLGYADQEDIMPYKEWIDLFEQFSIREESGQRIVNTLSNYNAPVTVDPTLLLKNDHWERLLSKTTNRLKGQRYIVCYFLNKKHYRENYRFARQFAKDKGLVLYTIDYAIHKEVFGHKSLMNLGPLEFLVSIYDAQYVFTDSFHGTVFSLVYKKRFISINNDEKNGDTRRKELLSIYHQEGLYKTVKDNISIIDEIEYSNKPDQDDSISFSIKYALEIIEQKANR